MKSRAGWALAGAIVKAVAGALSLGLSAGAELVMNIGQKVYSACKKVFDFINDIVKVVAEYTKINEALAQISASDFSPGKMFEISPLLACYYFISIPTNNIIRFQAAMMAMKGTPASRAASASSILSPRYNAVEGSRPARISCRPSGCGLMRVTSSIVITVRK